MELDSPVAAIIELFSTCQDCYSFYKTRQNAERKTRVMTKEFDAEASILHSWGLYWDIHLPNNPNSSKLEDYLKQNPHKKHDVVKILLRIGELMTNNGDLLKNFGIKLTLSDAQGKSKESKFNEFRVKPEDSIDNIGANKAAMRNRVKLLRKCKWRILRGKNNDFSKLLKALRKHNTDLRHFCPDGTGKDLNRFLVIAFLNDHIEFNPLDKATKRMSQLVQKEKDPSIKEGLELLRDMVKIKDSAGLHNTEQISDYHKRHLLRYQLDMLCLRHPEEPSTLAVLTKDDMRSMVYVEFKSYKDDTRTMTHDREVVILKLGRLLMVDSKYGSSRLNTMLCLGLFKDSKKKRIGFIFELPNVKPRKNFVITRNSDWDDYEPCRLSNILNSGTRPFKLNWRLSLAKEVVDTIIRLHAIGGLHKNIRSDSVLFSSKSYLALARTDYSKHLLMGHDFIRTDASPTSSQGGMGKCPDIYHHPDQRKSPDRAYQYAYDIYSLGILLLEIGLWKSLHQIVRGKQNYSPDRLHKYILETVDVDLPIVCGEIYSSVAKTFISIESRNSLKSMNEQRDKCAKMARELSRCVA
ncbi:uncharacterized protein F4807DRAFT_469075 [Annulohypoxylon truncatum]|uniref:uncharacterized protein n=1 Tax=Annulohypoxylon truncatum TaxID=327061 RepID=UPI002008EA8C|nr:uncharacterized protein F4807DRAFT_469075 [Annulohypoxylon truncatum]KAI1207871.1 hypothetical protein F4807DRAFT_469075 [Annulohypoxylon truncatum]